MSDTHHRTTDPQQPLVSQFLLDHLEYVIKRSDGMPETALDYSHPEVCEHRLQSWGAEGLRFWNLPNNFNPICGQKWGQAPRHPERMGRWARAVSDPGSILAGPRRYHYLPLYKRDITQSSGATHLYEESGRSLHGAFKGAVLYFHEGQRGERQEFPFRMADGRRGEKLNGSFRFRVFHCRDEDALDIDINGVPVAPENVSRVADAHDPDLPWTWFSIALTDCPPFRGDNDLGLTWQSRVDHGLQVPYMEELAILVEP